MWSKMVAAATFVMAGAGAHAQTLECAAVSSGGGISSNGSVLVVGQEIMEVIPEAVSKGSDGYYSVDYGRVTPLLVEALKELHATVKDREVQIHLQQLQTDSQRAEIDDLRREVQGLRAQMAAMASIEQRFERIEASLAHATAGIGDAQTTSIARSAGQPSGIDNGGAR